MHLDLTGLPCVFLAHEARAAGVGARRLTTATANGQVLRLGRGAYADPVRWPADPRQQHLHLALAAGRAVGRSAVSHLSAAVLEGLPHPRSPLPRPAVTVDDAVRSRSAGSWMTLFRGELPASHVVPDASHRRTTPTRTVIDCARHLSTGDGLAVADAAVRAGSSSAEALTAMREFQRRWPGIRRADTVLALLDPRREGWLESWSAAAFHRLELPRWIPQVIVHDEHGGFLGRVDGYWPELGVVGEADGRGKYLGDVDPRLDRRPEAVARRVLAAAEREVGLRAAGLGVVRWTTTEVTSRQLLVAARWRSEVARTDPRLIRATMTCSCCHAPVTSCDFGADYARAVA